MAFAKSLTVMQNARIVHAVFSRTNEGWFAMRLTLRCAIVVFCAACAVGQVDSFLPDSPGVARDNPHLFAVRQLDRVRLSEILISTPQPYDASQVTEARHKAEDIRDAIRGGASFAETAKAKSQGPSAALGGDLGFFKHGVLAPTLDEMVFRFRVGDVSDVLRTKQGYVLLQVTERDDGLRVAKKGREVGALDILSDTQGVDFGPYLQRMLADIKENWYSLIPESAQMKKGRLAIEFAIRNDGQVAGMKLVASSNDPNLDRPAWGSITASNPYPPLPSEFKGPFLALRVRFYYNPDKSDFK